MPTHHAVGAAQRDGADPAAAQVLLHFAGQIDLHTFVFRLDRDRVVDRRHVTFGELDVKGRTNHLSDAADVFSCGGHGWFSVSELTWVQ